MKTIITTVMMVFCFIPSQAQETAYMVSVHGSITTASKLFVNPYGLDESSRNQSLPLDGVWGIGIDVRRALNANNLSIGVSAEFLQTSKQIEIQGANSIISTEDGYFAIPVEVSGYFSIPFSSESFHMYIGGGFGAYFGERRYSYAEVESHVVHHKPGFGIHVLSGVEFSISPIISIRSELKFREVQFETTNVFSQDQSKPGIHLPYNLQPFTSRVSIDGILLNAGIVVTF